MNEISSQVGVGNGKSSDLPLLYFIGAWAIYAFFYTVFKIRVPLWNGILSSFAIFILDIIVFGCAFYLWRQSIERGAKRIFGLFAISAFFALFADVGYQISHNILYLSHQKAYISTFLSALHRSSTIIFLFFLFLVFAGIVPKIKWQGKKVSNFLASVPVIAIVLVLIVMFILSSKMYFIGFSADKFYDGAKLLLQITGFLMALLCLITAKNKGILYITFAYLLNVIAALMMNTELLAQSYGTISFAETIWLLNGLLLIYGLIYFKRSGTYNEALDNWTYTSDSFVSQTTYWCTAIGLLAASLGFILAYIFMPRSEVFLAKNGVQALAILFIIFSVFWAVMSSVFCKLLSRFATSS